MNSDRDTPEDLASILALARRAAKLVSIPQDRSIPRDFTDAYAVQHRILDLGGATVAGWKVGSKSPDGPIQGSPLPSGAVRRSPGMARATDHPVLGLELEIAFRLGRSFAPSTQPCSNEEVLEAVEAMAAAVEVVSSRYAGWPKVDKLLQLADLQNHGALVIAEETPYDASYPFVRPVAHFEFNGMPTFAHVPSNPAGDPRRLLSWVVNHATSRGLTVGPDLWITTGSYTGMYFPEVTGEAIGSFRGFPEIRLKVEMS